MANIEKIVLVGMGNPLLDISVDLGDDTTLLTKYELKMGDAILAEEKHQPLYKELAESYKPQYIAGGATQNSIRVAQWMIGTPGSTAYFGCVGNDEFGELMKARANADGVITHYMVDDTTPTGTCAVLVGSDGERSLCANLSAANNFKPTHLETDIAKSIYTTAKCYYIAGFFLTVSVESLQVIGEHAAAQNKPFALNLSAPFIVDFFGDQVATAMEYADYLFCNESEAAAYANKHDLGEDLKEVAMKIAALPKKNTKRSRTVVFTQGSRSTLVCHDSVVTEYPVEPLAQDLLVDTNGAGDAFVGGFLSQLVQGKSIEQCVNAGHFAARFIIQQSGTQLPAACDYKA